MPGAAEGLPAWHSVGVKIALISDCYLPRLGGIEVQTHDLAQELLQQGHEVEVFTATQGAAGERGGATSVDAGLRVHRLAIALPWQLPVNPLAPPELSRRLVAGGFDVAHLQTGVVSPFAWDSARVTTRLGLPTAMTWHCMLDRAETPFRLSGQVRRWAEHGVVMSAVSGVAAEPLRRLVGAGRTVAVLPNGIDVDRWVAPVPPTHDPAEPVRIVTAMRLAARKRPLPLMRLLADVHRRIDGRVPVQVTVFGDGPDRGKVAAFLDANGMSDWVTLAGRVTRDDLRAAYVDSDLYLSPARLESFGIAALEARSVGLPVIARAGSGVGEFITDGVNGRIVASDEEMAGAITQLCLDAEARRAMRRHNVEHRPIEDWPSVAKLAVAEYVRAIEAAE